jgi:PAS domain S-box-containing protein
MNDLEEEPRRQIKELEKRERKYKREIQFLQNAVEQERTVAQAKANQQAARSLAQRERDKYMKLLLGNSPNMLLLLDKSDRLAYCTDSFLQKTGIENLSLIAGRTFQEIFSRFGDSLWVESVHEDLRQAVLSNTSLTFEDTRDLGDGQVRKYLIQFKPMLNEEGGNEGAIMAFHDVTNIEKAREEA